MALAKFNLKNLRAHDYFTEVRVGGLEAALGTVSEFESELRELRSRCAPRPDIGVEPGRSRYRADPKFGTQLLQSPIAVRARIPQQARRRMFELRPPPWTFASGSGKPAFLKRLCRHSCINWSATLQRRRACLARRLLSRPPVG